MIISYSYRSHDQEAEGINQRATYWSYILIAMLMITHSKLTRNDGKSTFALLVNRFNTLPLFIFSPLTHFHLLSLSFSPTSTWPMDRPSVNRLYMGAFQWAQSVHILLQIFISKPMKRSSWIDWWEKGADSPSLHYVFPWYWWCTLLRQQGLDSVC